MRSLSGLGETLIIADSNLRRAGNLRSEMELHVFPGSKLHHITRILNSAVINSNVKNILIAVGINNKSSNPYTCSADLTNIVDVCKNLNRTCHFLGVSHRDLPVRERINIDELNQMASKLLKTGYIPPLSTQQVVISAGDRRHRIHHDDNTVSKIIQ